MGPPPPDDLPHFPSLLQYGPNLLTLLKYHGHRLNHEGFNRKAGPHLHPKTHVSQ